MSFAACLPIILAHEGGYVNDPHDPGGATNFGITIATLSAWLGRKATIDEVKALNPSTVKAIYLANYYNPSYACDCPDGVDLMIFDEAVNQGVKRAAKTLQTCLGLTAATFRQGEQAALAAADPVALINAILANRTALYQSLNPALYKRYSKGWLSRLKQTTATALTMVKAKAPTPNPMPNR